jgi:GT2 family glycosyltransferase
LDLVTRIDEALSSASQDLTAVSALFGQGGFARDNFQRLTARRAILALKSDDQAVAIAEAYAATNQNPTNSEYFALLSHLLSLAQADDLALEMLAKAVELEPDDAAQQLAYLQRLAIQRPGYLKFALPRALPILKAENVAETLALAERAGLAFTGACWRDDTGVGRWVCGGPKATEMTLKASWFIDDGWTVQQFRLTIDPAIGHATAQFPWRDGAEACTVRLNEADTVLPGSPLFGPVDLHPKGPHHQTANTVEVIIPIYDGLKDTKACISSVLNDRGRRPISLTLVLDCPPNAELADYIAQIDRAGLAKVLYNRENLGFTASVNRALRLAMGRDVVLLNSDTVVPDAWIDRLHAAAYAASDIGTITPLTNNGEIVSFPKHGEQNPLPLDATAEQVDRFARIANAGDVVDLPTGVGFCLFIKAECLKQVGLLDSGFFGKGYGEETDFCLRARKQGWRSVCATGVFVTHRSSVSFGDQKSTLVRRNMPEISRRYPEYPELMGSFIRHAPLNQAKHKLARQLLANVMPKGGALIIAPPDWRSNDAVRPLRFEFASRDVPVLWLSTDPKRPNRLLMVSDGLGGLGALQYNLPNDIPDLLADLEQLDLKAIHWLAGLADVDLTHGLVALGAEDILHVMTPALVDFLARPAAAALIKGADKTVIYSSWGQEWAVERGLVPQAARVSEARYDLAAHVPQPSGGRLNIAVVDGLDCIAGFKTLLGMARHSAAHGLSVRFFLFGNSVDDAALARTGVVTGLGVTEPAHRGKLVELLDCAHVLSIAQDDDPSEERMRQMARLAPHRICFSGGCRSDLAALLPNVLVLPRDITAADIMARLGAGHPRTGEDANRDAV